MAVDVGYSLFSLPIVLVVAAVAVASLNLVPVSEQ